MTRGFVVTGTDTGVGKTIVAAGLAGALGAAYWKPIQAGLDGKTDSQVVKQLAADRLAELVPEAYRLKTACSPHEAAHLSALSIDSGQLNLPHISAPIIVEGAGGLMVPINDDELMIDLFKRWQLPLILVARTSLGTINHSLLSVQAIRHAGLELAGIIFVGEPNPASELAIARFGKVRHLGRLPWLDPLSFSTLLTAFKANLRLDLIA